MDLLFSIILPCGLAVILNNDVHVWSQGAPMGSLVTIGFSEKGGTPADVALRDPLTIQNYHAGHRRWPFLDLLPNSRHQSLTLVGGPSRQGSTGIVLDGWGATIRPHRFF